MVLFDKDMDLVSTPTTLECSECGIEIEDAGYIPATESEDGYEPTPEAAICDSCGFNEVGMMGCAPTLDEVTQAGANDVLLYVTATHEGIAVVSARE